MNLREQLKNKTMTFHKAAEEASAKYAPIDKPSGYYAFLCCMHRMYTKYSTALDKGSAIMKLPPRSQQIIKALKVDISGSPKYNHLPKNSTTLPFISEQSLLGISYVFEGSALGSHILINRIPAEAESNYLKRLVKETPLRWPQTIKFLSNIENDYTPAITEACNVFKDIAETMKELSIEIN